MTSERERRLLDTLPAGLFVAGEWRDAQAGRTFAVTDPATGAQLHTVADASARDALLAVDAASDAAAAWANTPPRTRGEMLRRGWDLLQERRDDFALLMTLEMGKPLAEAHAEVTYGGEFLRWFSEEAARIAGSFGSNPEATGQMIVSRHPVGPCYLVTPWNFPLAMATRKIAPALAAGCTVVLKPAEATPLTSLLFAKLLADAGLPAGVVNVIPTTDPAAVSEQILADPRLRKLSFTGSTAVGRTLLEQAAGNVLRTSMELGGNAPFLVFEDADLDAAVDGAMAAKFRNIGQACTAANRFLVHEEIAEEFTARITARVQGLGLGRGTSPGVNIGPLIDERAVRRVHALVLDAVADGAVLHAGGRPGEGPGSFYPPTVLSRVPPRSAIFRTEVFGPVLPITVFRTDAEALELANHTEYGLVAYVYTRDLTRAQRMIASLEVGMLGINAGLISNAAAPFGGVKQSGLGREGGSQGIDEYLTTKYTLIPSR